MDLHFFFSGAMSREETASAFLATLLKQRADFLGAFLTFAGLSDPGLNVDDWTISVEADFVDVRMESLKADTVLIIENKIRSGAVQQDQLLRYYQAEIKKGLRSSVRVIFVVPDTGIGASEVKRFIASKCLRDRDTIHHLSWKELAIFAQHLPLSDPDHKAITSGFRMILATIEADRRAKYPMEAGREIVAAIVDGVLRRLSTEFQSFNLRRWPEKNFFQIYSSKCNVTLWLEIEYPSSGPPAYLPVGIVPGEPFDVILRSRVKPTAAAFRKPQIRDLWQPYFKSGVLLISGLDRHALEGRWFVLEIRATGTPDQLEEAMLGFGSAVLSDLVPFR